MDTDGDALRSLAQAYFDAAYEMDADRFASLFHPSSSVTKVDSEGEVSFTPISDWLAAVRNIPSPKQLSGRRDDQLISIDVEGKIALLKVKLLIAPRNFTDMLSCVKSDGAWAIAQKVVTYTTS